MLELRATDGGASGTVSLDKGGPTHPFTATAGAGDAGLYRIQQEVDGTAEVSTWIVLSDGTQRGVKRRPGTTSPFEPVGPLLTVPKLTTTSTKSSTTSTSPTTTLPASPFAPTDVVVIDLGGGDVEVDRVAVSGLLTGEFRGWHWPGDPEPIPGVNDAVIGGASAPVNSEVMLAIDATSARDLGGFDLRVGDTPVTGVVVLTKRFALEGGTSTSLYELLSALDSDKNDALTIQDPVFPFLRLFNDVNGDGFMVPTDVTATSPIVAIPFRGPGAQSIGDGLKLDPVNVSTISSGSLKGGIVTLTSA